MKTVCRWLFLVLVACGQARAESPVQVIVLTGQSNSLGTTADPAEKTPGPGTEPEDRHVRFFWSNRSTRSGDGPSVLIGDSGGKFLPLQAQQGEGKNKTFWGPEISLGRTLYRAGHRDFVIVKASRGGGGNRHWLPDGQMFRHVVRTVKTAVSVLEAEGVDYRISHLLYIQGESDSPAEAAEAGSRVAALLDNLRKALPHADRMKLVIVGIAAAGPSRDVVRAKHAAMAEQRDDMTYIDNLDLQPRLYDRLHFDRAAKIEIGRRLARAIWVK